MKVAFMGTPEFAVPTLERLIESRHAVVLVATQPDRASGRGQKIKPSPVKELAMSRGLRVEQPATLKKAHFDQTLRDAGAEVVVVAAYGLKLPPEVLTATPHGCLNVHASLLPRWRGAAPVQRAILAGDLKTGVSIMRMSEGMDEGPIIAQEEIDILPDDDALSVTNMLAMVGADLMLRTLDRLESEGRLEATPQEESLVTLAPKIEKSEGWINWDRDIDSIICHIHGLRPWPGAFSKLGATTIRVIEAEPDTSFDDSSVPPQRRARPGTVVALARNLGPIVRVRDGYLLLTQVQPENKKAMGGGDWINGGGVKTGDCFSSGVPAETANPLDASRPRP